MRNIAFALIVAFGSATPALADPMGGMDMSKPAPICADRPSKMTGTCTVPTGMVQIETGLVDWMHDRDGDETMDFTMIGQSLIKYGVSSRADVELGITPYEEMRMRDPMGVERLSGFGDMLVRVKYRLTADDAPVAVAIDPFVKVPTAGHMLGNGKVEGGLLIPISAQLGKGPLTLGLGPELDLRADADGTGHHVAMVQVFNLGLMASSRLMLGAELWGQWDWDPAGSVNQASADGSIAYLVSDNVQLDVGANFGLNDQTPDAEVYTGVSVRF